MEFAWVIGFGMLGMDKGVALASGFGVNLFAHIASAFFAIFAVLYMTIKKQ